MQICLCHPSDFKGFHEYDEEKNQFQGTIQQFVTDSIQLFHQGLLNVGLNATFEIQPKHGVGSFDDTTGSYDGCLGRIQRNQSDLILQLFEYPVAAQNLSEGIIIYDTLLTIASAYDKVKSTSISQITSSFASFSCGIWLTCALVAMIISIVFKMREAISSRRRHINHYSVFYTFTHLTRLHGMPATGITRKLLFISASVFALVVVHYFLTLIKTELVVTKDPILFHSYQDIIDRQAMPIFIKGMGYDELFKKQRIPVTRKNLWSYSMKNFDSDDLYIELNELVFLLAAITVFEQKAVIIVEHALIPVIEASGCPLRARNPSDLLKIVNWINDEKKVGELLSIASVDPEQEEMVKKHARKPHQVITSPPEFIFHHSVDPAERSFSQGLVLNPQTNPRVLNAIKFVVVRAIETGLTIHTLELAQKFDILGNYGPLNTLVGPELKSRRSEVTECMSASVLKDEAIFHPLTIANYSNLFFIIGLMIFLSVVVLIFEIFTGRRVHFRARRRRINPPPNWVRYRPHHHTSLYQPVLAVKQAASTNQTVRLVKSHTWGV